MERKELSFISPRDLHARMASRDPFLLMDTLTKDHFVKVHLPGAKNACVFEVTFLDQASRLTEDKTKKIVLYGWDGKTMDAPTAAEKLTRAGYENLLILEGGLVRWNEEGLGLEGSEPSLPAQLQAFPVREDRTYMVDPEQSLITWFGRNPNTTHHGTLRLSSGEISVKHGIIGGTFEIDMTSINNINLEGDPLKPVLISHLKSDDFFFTAIFPKATFRLKKVTAVQNPTRSAPNFDVTGMLELRGTGKEIRFPATANPLPDGGIGIEAHFDIDRTRWNIIYGSSRFFEHLGMHLVYDLISIQLRIVTL